MANTDVEKMILSLLATRTAGRHSASKTICPSEVARTLWPNEWRNHMETVRLAAGCLATNNRLVVMQKGQPVDISTVRGPIRLALPPSD